MLRALILTMLAFIISACATPYQPYGFDGWGWGGGGYSDVQLNDDIYKVSFKANNATSQDTVQNLLLRRCAELTKSKGYNYFVILGANESRTDSQYTTPTRISTQSHGYQTGNFYGDGFNGYYNGTTSDHSNVVINPGQTYNFSKYLDTAVIKMLHSNKMVPSAFKADAILASYSK